MEGKVVHTGACMDGRKLGGSKLVALCSLSLLACNVGPPGEGEAAPALAQTAVTGELTFAPVADAAVREQYPSTNYGTTPTLLADTSPREASYLRFVVSGVTSPVRGAKVRLYVLNGSVQGPQLYASAGGWEERTITWNTRPAHSGSALGSPGAVAVGTWVEYDVSALVKGDGQFNFAIIPVSTDGTDFASREATDPARRPRLVLTTGDAQQPPPPPPGSTLTLPPSADAAVRAQYPSTNYGTTTTLLADTSPQEASYVRFSVTGVTGTVSGAKVRFHVLNGTVQGPQLYTAAGGWDERTITWNNRPAHSGAALGSPGALAVGSWVEYDVSAIVKGNGDFNFAVIPVSTDGTDFASREHGQASLRPQLVLTVASGSDDCVSRTETVVETYRPLLDTFVDRTRPTQSFQDAPTLEVDGDPRKEAYLRFQIDVHGRTVRSARLKFWATDGTRGGPRVYSANADQNYSNLTWNTRPALTGGPHSYVERIAANTFVTYDVTAGVKDGLFALALIPTTSDGVDFASLEWPTVSQRPVLDVVSEVTYCTHRGAPRGATMMRSQKAAPGLQSVHRLAVDAAGNAIVATLHEPEGFTQLDQYDPEGRLLWSRRLPVEVAGVALTPLRNVLVTGRYDGALDLGGGALPHGRGAMYVLKLNPNGATAWSRGYQPRCSDTIGAWDGNSWPKAIATDSAGSVLITGSVLGVATLDGVQVGSNDSCHAAQPKATLFVAKLNWQGTGQWGDTQPSGVNGSQGLAIDAGEGDVVYVGGRVERRPFLARYSAAGAREWVANLAPYGQVSGVSAVAGAVVFSAELTNTWDHGYEPGTVGRVRAGVVEWQARMNAALQGVDTDRDGNILVYGHAPSAVDAGGGVLYTDKLPGRWISFAARLSPAGLHQWSRVFDELRLNAGAQFANGQSLLGGMTYVSPSDSDAVLLRLAP